MPAVDISPAAALRYIARYQPTTPSIVYAGGDLDASGAAARVELLAGVLRSQGIREGDRIAYLGLNSPTLLLLHLACASIKAVFVPINFRLTPSEVGAILTDCAARLAVIEPDHVPVVEEIAEEIPTEKFVVVDDDPAAPLRHEPPRGWHRLSGVVAAADGVEPLPVSEHDLAALLYTSGTTGRAKGVILTHGNLFWNHVNVDSVVETHRTDVTHASAPLFHIGGLNALVLRTLVRGGTVVIRRAFDPQEALDDFHRLRVNTLFAVPAMFEAIARLPGFATADLSSVRSAIVAGAPVPPTLIRRYADHGVLLQQAWGLTETAPFATYLPTSWTVQKAGSAGVPMPHTKLKLTDPVTGAEITEPGVRGELCVSGPNVTQGYWNNPEATRAAFDDQGWFHSGDIGHLDVDGFLYVVDRMKDMIISGGENVYPAEVEHAIIGCPGIAEVAVVGSPDAQWGETVVAVITPEPGCTPSLEEVREYAAARLARYKLPRKLVLVPALARNGSGKLDKVRLRQLVNDQQTSVQ